MNRNLFFAFEKQFPITNQPALYQNYTKLLINLPKNVIDDKSPLSLVLICKSH